MFEGFKQEKYTDRAFTSAVDQFVRAKADWNMIPIDQMMRPVDPRRREVTTAVHYESSRNFDGAKKRLRSLAKDRMKSLGVEKAEATRIEKSFEELLGENQRSSEVETLINFARENLGMREEDDFSGEAAQN